MKAPFIILAIILVLFVSVVLYGVRILWKNNSKFLSIILIIAAALVAYIFYPMIEPLFWH